MTRFGPILECQENFRRVKVLGQGFDKKLVNKEILTKFVKK